MIRNAARMAVVALGLAWSSLPAGAQAGNPPPTRSIDAVCPAGEVPDAGFTDVGNDSPHRRAIDCLVFYGIASGKSATTFDPIGVVKRDQMATLVAGMIDALGVGNDFIPRLPAGEAEPFPCDVAGTGNPHQSNIARLAAAGIVAGGPAGLGSACYGPGLSVTRAQMATFVEAALVFLEIPIIEGPEAAFVDYYVDDNGSSHERNINAITSEGIATGVGTNSAGGDLYGPQNSVRRDQTASLLARAIAYVASP